MLICLLAPPRTTGRGSRQPKSTYNILFWHFPKDGGAPTHAPMSFSCRISYSLLLGCKPIIYWVANLSSSLLLLSLFLPKESRVVTYPHIHFFLWTCVHNLPPTPIVPQNRALILNPCARCDSEPSEPAHPTAPLISTGNITKYVLILVCLLRLSHAVRSWRMTSQWCRLRWA